MSIKQQYQIKLLRFQLREIDLQLEELGDAAEDDFSGHLQFIKEMIDDLKLDLLHVMIFHKRYRLLQFMKKINP